VLEQNHVLPQEVVEYYIGQELQVLMYAIVVITFLKDIAVQQDIYYLVLLVHMILLQIISVHLDIVFQEHHVLDLQIYQVIIAQVLEVFQDLHVLIPIVLLQFIAVQMEVHFLELLVLYNVHHLHPLLFQ
jgi:hypothetical protein